MKTGRMLIVLFTVFLFSHFFSQAECYYPFQEYSFTANYNGCLYVCYICTYADSTFPYQQTSYVDRFDVLSIDCFDMFEDPLFWEQVEENVLMTLLDKGTWPPCPQSTYNYTLKSSTCWKIVNDHANGMFTMKNCGYDTYCMSLYKVCTDFTQSPPNNIWSFEGKSSVGTPNCSGNGMPELPPSGKTENEPWETDCFILDCN